MGGNEKKSDCPDGGSAGQDLANLVLTKLENISTDIKNMDSKITNLETNNQSLQANIIELKADFNKIVPKLQKDLNSCKKDLFVLKKENNILKSEIIEMKRDLIENSQVRFQNVLKIDNIPIVEGENLFSILKDIADKVGMDLSSEMIDDIYRLRIPNRNSNFPPAIIVKFVRNSVKKNFIINAKQKRSSLIISQNQVFVNEFLSPLKLSLFRRARQLKLEGKLKQVWTKNGIILMRKEENSQPTIIRTHEDLADPDEKFPATQSENIDVTPTETDIEDIETDSSSVRTTRSQSTNKRKPRSIKSNNLKSFLVKTASQKNK
ncbi:uncharacterized protein [Rhodnius prolixus]|uniref:uncharacterized protein n=1 Tax=Rhodnius prolixus TaxID=13249 RepID=UPI003D18D876